MSTAAPSRVTTRVRARVKPVAERRVPFADLVRLHHRWRASVEETSPLSEAERDKLDKEYHAALDRFEAEHGQITTAYWCSNVESAVALTKGPPPRGMLRRLRSPAPRFHRVSDWATKDDAEIARALHKCDELAIRTTEMLRGRSRRICMQLVMTSACHLLSLVDGKVAADRDPAAQRAALAAEQRELNAIAGDYRDAANGDAQLIYFGGMALGIGSLGLLYAVGGSILNQMDVPAALIVGCLVAGAMGAVVSVIARINSGSFALDADVAPGYTLFLGTIRPWIGSIFGLLTYFAVTSGFVELFSVPDSGLKEFYFMCVIAFAAGFSERWAQDTLTGGLTGRGRATDPTPANAKRGAAAKAEEETEGAVSPAAHE